MNATEQKSAESPRAAAEVLKLMARRLLHRLEQPEADLRTLAEQARQTGALVLAELEPEVSS